MSLVVDIEKKLGGFTLHSRFETGEGTMALLGASGCGKSVTLKCIAGIMTPDKGRIVLDGETLFDSDKRINLTPQQRQVGYLFQQYALFPGMTVLQNIACGIRTGSRAEKRRRAEELAHRFRLEGLEKKYPAQISGGQQQRTALARIFASEPRAILLDEPFSALDGFLKWNLELELSELLKDYRGPILWVSHDLGECCRNCQTVCVMENGISGEITDMEKLVQHPTTEGAARLAGNGNFLPAERTDGGVKLAGWDIVLPLDAPADDLTVVIPDAAFTLGSGTNTAFVRRVIRDLNGSVVLLCPPGAADVPPLRVKIASGTVPAENSTIALGIHAEKCLCYRRA